MAAAALLLFGWLGDAVMEGERLRFDSFVRDTIHSWASPTLTSAMRVVTQFGSPAFLLAATAILVWRLANDGRRRAAVLLVVAAIGAEVLDELLKLVFHRQRPQPFFGYLLPLTFSFPSGHSVSSCAFYGVAAAILTRGIRSRVRKALVWIGAALLAGLIGFSRIYLGVHYPSDVVAGYCVAIVWVAAVRWSYSVWLRRRSRDEAPISTPPA